MSVIARIGNFGDNRTEKLALESSKSEDISVSVDDDGSSRGMQNFLVGQLIDRLSNGRFPFFLSFSPMLSRRCALLIGCLFCGSRKRKFILQVHTRCILVGCGYHDYCGIWWHDVRFAQYLWFYAVSFLFSICFFVCHRLLVPTSTYMPPHTNTLNHSLISFSIVSWFLASLFRAYAVISLSTNYSTRVIHHHISSLCIIIHIIISL